MLVNFFLSVCFALLSPVSFASLSKNALVAAEAVDLDKLAVPEIKLSKTGRSYLTYNKMGFDTTSSEANWLVQAFYDFAKVHDQSSSYFLEVGCGYGNVVQGFLKFLSQAKLIANDINSDHLLITRAKTQADHRQRLLLNQAAMADIKLGTIELKGMMVHRVMHFLSGEEVLASIRNSHSLLGRGGRLYIAVNSPFNKDFSDWFEPEYEANLNKGQPWPGEKLLVEKALPKQTYALPKYLHVMDERVLNPALEKNGFKIIKSGFISMKKFQTDISRDGREVYAVVAEKV